MAKRAKRAKPNKTTQRKRWRAAWMAAWAGGDAPTDRLEYHAWSMAQAVHFENDGGPGDWLKFFPLDLRLPKQRRRNPRATQESWEVRSYSPDESWFHQSLVYATSAADAIAKVKKRKQGLKGSRRFAAKREGQWYVDQLRSRNPGNPRQRDARGRFV